MRCGKIGYRNPAEAYKTAARMRKRHEAGAAFAYRCAICHQWHLAQRHDRQSRLRRKRKEKDCE
jgi:hypothetical protein